MNPLDHQLNHYGLIDRYSLKGIRTLINGLHNYSFPLYWGLLEPRIFDE
ncbi:hypothetical protein COLU111180_08980 [Cohnella lubricantis]|nr:hypothetical protein [Cohnella lubricantis]